MLTDAISNIVEKFSVSCVDSGEGVGVDVLEGWGEGVGFTLGVGSGEGDGEVEGAGVTMGRPVVELTSIPI